MYYYHPRSPAYGDTGPVTADPSWRNDDFFGGIHNDRMYGLTGDDTLLGNGGNDWLSGGDGDDSLYGHDDRDTLYGDAGDDFLAGNNDNDHLFGGAGNDTLYGGTGSNYLAGGDGNDELFGDYDNDRMFGGTGNDSLYGAEGNNTLVGGAGDDYLSGYRSDEALLQGGDGDDVILSLGYSDTIDGGAGFDIWFVASSSPVHVSLAQPNQNGGERVVVSIEGLAGGYDSDWLKGDAKANYLDGISGDDTLYGMGGNDWLYGQTGNDSIMAGVGHDSADGSYGNDFLDGGDGRDILLGGFDTDTLRGGRGIDSLDGGDGSGDIADFSDKTVSVKLTLAGLADARALVSGIEEDWVRNVEGIYGGSGADTLTGDAGNNILRGGAGADHLDGGAGIDMIDYADSSTGVVVRLGGLSQVSVGGVLEDWIVNFENAAGGSGRDRLVGDASANVLFGGAGIDTIDGGAGVDTVALAGHGRGVTLTLDGSHYVRAIIGSSAKGDWIRNVENLIGTSQRDILTGDANDNVFRPGAGRDRIDGGAGDHDVLDCSDFLGRLFLTLKGGAIAYYGNYQYPEEVRNVEDVIGGRGDDRIIGDHHHNRLIGGEGYDTLQGGGGNDTLDGSDGRGDVADYGDHSEGIAVTLNGAVYSVVSVNGVAEDYLRNIFRVIGGSGADRLTASAGGNGLAGGYGDDTLTGGLKTDFLEGNAGKDVFRFVTAVSGTAIDYIHDFNHADDIIELDDAVFAGLVGVPPSAMLRVNLTGNSAVSADDRIIYDASSGRLWYDEDGNAAGGVEAIEFAVLTDRPDLDWTDFTVV